MTNVLLTHLNEQRKSVEARTRAILERAEAEKRELTAQEATDFDKGCAEMTAMAVRVREIIAGIESERSMSESLAALGLGGPQASSRSGGAAVEDRASWTREDGRSAVVTASQRFADHPVVAEHAQRNAAAEKTVTESHGGLAPLVRALSTTGASAVIPTKWAGDIIDRARNYAAVLQAGAQVVPMETKTLQIGRLTGDPTARFRTEGSTITPADPTFDNVTLTATTMSALIVASMEWFQDSDNASALVADAIAQAFGRELDLNALFGGVAAGAEVGATGFNRSFAAPSPTGGILAGLLAQAPSSVLGGQTNGTTQTAATPWNEIIDTVMTPADYNETANALIWSPRMARRYAQQYDTTYQPLRRPAVLDGVEIIQTNQIPSNMTQGTSTTNMTDVFAGDFTKLLIGQRMGISIQILTERYAENGQIGIVAHWRGDVQMARPRAFACYRYLKNT